MAGSEPITSVVLVVGNRRDRAAHALASVLAQAGIEEAEVLLVDVATHAAPAVPGSDHPRVRPFKRERISFGDARAEGVRQARGRFVAFLEEHSLALPGWLRGTAAALSGEWTGAGPEVRNANPGQGLSDIVLLMNYGTACLPPARCGEAAAIPAHNSAFRRDALLGFGDELAELLDSEIVAQWRLAEQGHRLGIAPGVAIEHRHPTRLRELMESYYWMHRFLGYTRARVYAWPRRKRLLRAGAWPLVPFVRLWAKWRAARPQDVPVILRFAPMLLLSQAAGALGTAVGYMLGAGDSWRRFADHEFDGSRGETEPPQQGGAAA